MIDLGNRRELFVDYFLIDRLQNLQLRLHHPTPANVALTFDRPWEGAFACYVTVIHDGPLYRLYYRGWPDAERKDCGVTCYAESTDGITFHRPTLGLVEVNGSRDNNVILAGDHTHNFAPFLDQRPGVPADQRFKALTSIKHDGQKGLGAYVSGDGVRWRLLQDAPVITRGAFDSQNVAFWSSHEGCYVSYYRTWDKAGNDPTKFSGKRTVSRATSDDFVHWSDGEPMSYGETPAEELYTNQTHPYCRAPHLYLSLPKRFVGKRRTLSDAEVAQYGVIPKYALEVSEGVFMTSRGGNRYDRTFMEAFVRPGPERANWVSRSSMAACGVVVTGPLELSLYYEQRYAQPAQYLRRFTLRPDGFVSVHAPYAGGELLTKPFTFSGRELQLNLASSACGGAKVEIQDEQGTPLPGYTLEECTEVFGDLLEAPVAWGERRDLASLAGRPVRLRFALRDADLYALRFA